MTWDLPWVASGSPEIPLDVARAFSYAATDGVSGIIGQPFSNVLKITQTGTASGNIQTAPGAFVAVSSFAGAINESYVGRNDGTINTAVPPTGGSTRSDLVYAHITDPSQAGQPATAAIVETRVITNVPNNTTNLNSVFGYENQTGLALARIDRPAGTSTVTQAQIVDLRVSALQSIVGDMKPFAGISNYVPANWLPADGRELSRTLYPELFAMIGTPFGVGNGSTTFNVPDTRGRALLGAGQGPSLTNRVHGAKGGAETHTLTENELANHGHGVNDPGHAHFVSAGTSITTVAESAGSGVIARTNDQYTNPAMTGIVIMNTGGNAPHNNMQPWIAVNMIIRVK